MRDENDEHCLLSDDDILRGLDQTRVAFEGGDRYALFEALAMCAAFQAVLPEWLADAILDIERDIETGERVDFNQRFGWKPDRSTARHNLHKRKQLTSRIIAALLRRRVEGANFDRGGEDTVFDAVRTEIGIPRATVITTYKNNLWLKDVKSGNPQNINYGYGDIVVPRGRRRGRSILSDFDKN